MRTSRASVLALMLTFLLPVALAGGVPPEVLAQDTADPGTGSERNVLYLPALGVYTPPEQTEWRTGDHGGVRV